MVAATQKIYPMFILRHLFIDKWTNYYTGGASLEDPISIQCDIQLIKTSNTIIYNKEDLFTDYDSQSNPISWNWNNSIILSSAKRTNITFNYNKSDGKLTFSLPQITWLPAEYGAENFNVIIITSGDLDSTPEDPGIGGALYWHFQLDESINPANGFTLTEQTNCLATLDLNFSSSTCP
jgi:hypothetical protein